MRRAITDQRLTFSLVPSKFEIRGAELEVNGDTKEIRSRNLSIIAYIKAHLTQPSLTPILQPPPTMSLNPSWPLIARNVVAERDACIPDGLLLPGEFIARYPAGSDVLTAAAASGLMSDKELQLTDPSNDATSVSFVGGLVVVAVD